VLFDQLAQLVVNHVDARFLDEALDLL